MLKHSILTFAYRQNKSRLIRWFLNFLGNWRIYQLKSSEIIRNTQRLSIKWGASHGDLNGRFWWLISTLYITPDVGSFDITEKVHIVYTASRVSTWWGQGTHESWGKKKQMNKIELLTCVDRFLWFSLVYICIQLIFTGLHATAL